MRKCFYSLEIVFGQLSGFLSTRGGFVRQLSGFLSTRGGFVRQLSGFLSTPRRVCRTTVWLPLHAAEGLSDSCLVSSPRAEGLSDNCLASSPRRGGFTRQLSCIPCTLRRVYQTSVLHTLHAAEGLSDKCFVYLARHARYARQAS